MTRLDEIKARCEAATPGPWRCVDKGNSVRSHAIKTVAFDGEPSINICCGISPKTANAAFIAHSREDIPFLLAEVERLNAERDAAVRDLRRDCTTCEHKGKSGLSEPCLNCQGANYARWEWRGGPADEN